jgi:hypothetical protein
MLSVARPVYSYLESLYASGDDVTEEELRAAKDVKQASSKALFEEQPSLFKAPTRKRSDEISIQFKVKRSQIQAVQHHLERPTMHGKRALCGVWASAVV